MPLFVKGGAALTPFGRNQYLRSTKKKLTNGYTCAASTVPAVTIDGNAGQKILQPGTVMAKITSGADAGKVGPFQAGVTDGRQTLANIVGINDTFLPWQLIEGDREISCTYEASVVQGWCTELNSSGVPIVLSNTTAASLLPTSANTGVSVTFH